MEDIIVSIELPTDKQGFTLLKCYNCGEMFKLHPSDVKDDGVLFVSCPSCGIYIESFMNDEVLELGLVKLENQFFEQVYEDCKKLEKEFNKGPLVFKAGKKPIKKYERHLSSNVEAFEKAHFVCCKREAMIKPLLKITGCYCPFCGVKQYEFK